MGAGRGQAGGFGIPGGGIGSLAQNLSPGMGGRFPMPATPAQGQFGMMPAQGMDAQMNAQRASEAFYRDEANMFGGASPQAIQMFRQNAAQQGQMAQPAPQLGGTPGMFPSQSSAMGAMGQGLGSLNYRPMMLGGI